MDSHTFIGPLIHINENNQLTTVYRAAITVKNGKIENVTTDPVIEEIIGENVTVLTSHQFLIPGFIDCHTHAVQLPNLGIGYDKSLLEWLESYTFPLEKKYRDNKFADHVFDAVIKRSLSMGTTTACYFASLYPNASLILAQKAAKYGQRAFIGKVNMNISRSDEYFENTEDSIKNTKQFIKEINKMNNILIKPIITPRFALSCSLELMTELGKLANKEGLRIQTHISENNTEIELVKSMFENFSSYAAVYDAAGLLTNKTILAHGVHLTCNEVTLLKERGCAIIHCPSSNTCLKSGLCDVQSIRREGVKVGLGTDVSGGQSLSLLDTMRSALQVSSHLSMMKTNYDAINYKDVFFMATLGGAEALAIDNEVGNFIPGKQFDALLVDISVVDGPLDDLCESTLEEKLQRFIYSGDDRNIINVYVHGRKVK